MKRRHDPEVAPRSPSPSPSTAAPAASSRLDARAPAVAFAMTLAATTAGAAADGRDFDCLIEPAQVVELRSPVIGLLQQVHARRGELIRQGQVLVTIESSVERSAVDTARYRADAQGALKLARERVAATREKARRMVDLSKEAFVSAQAADDAAADARLAEAELVTAKENAELARLEHRESIDQLNRRVLRSPFNGVVVDQYLYPGALVDAGDGRKPILKIAQTRPLAVQAMLPFQVFPQVKVGASAVVRPEPPFGGEYAAPVATVDRVIDSAAGTFGVVVLLPNEQNALPGGIRCKVRIDGVR